MRAASSSDGPLYGKLLILVNLSVTSRLEQIPDTSIHKAFSNGRAEDFAGVFVQPAALL